tara:strand:+ start:354 stop:599 length:246 start_codon:yes stop_codon:yes gene_type:complete
MTAADLLEDSFQKSPIGDTFTFQWYVTPIGIAALIKVKDTCFLESCFNAAIQEGLEIGLDLSREERERQFSSRGWAILFYS